MLVETLRNVAKRALKVDTITIGSKAKQEAFSLRMATKAALQEQAALAAEQAAFAATAERILSPIKPSVHIVSVEKDLDGTRKLVTGKVQMARGPRLHRAISEEEQRAAEEEARKARLAFTPPEDPTFDRMMADYLTNPEPVSEPTADGKGRTTTLARKLGKVAAGLGALSGAGMGLAHADISPSAPGFSATIIKEANGDYDVKITNSTASSAVVGADAWEENKVYYNQVENGSKNEGEWMENLSQTDTVSTTVDAGQTADVVIPADKVTHESAIFAHTGNALPQLREDLGQNYHNTNAEIAEVLTDGPQSPYLPRDVSVTFPTRGEADITNSSDNTYYVHDVLYNTHGGQDDTTEQDLVDHHDLVIPGKTIVIDHLNPNDCLNLQQEVVQGNIINPLQRDTGSYNPDNMAGSTTYGAESTAPECQPATATPAATPPITPTQPPATPTGTATTEALSTGTPTTAPETPTGTPTKPAESPTRVPATPTVSPTVPAAPTGTATKEAQQQPTAPSGETPVAAKSPTSLPIVPPMTSPTLPPFVIPHGTASPIASPAPTIVSSELQPTPLPTAKAEATPTPHAKKHHKPVYKVREKEHHHGKPEHKVRIITKRKPEKTPTPVPPTDTPVPPTPTRRPENTDTPVPPTKTARPTPRPWTPTPTRTPVPPTRTPVPPTPTRRPENTDTPVPPTPTTKPSHPHVRRHGGSGGALFATPTPGPSTKDHQPASAVQSTLANTVSEKGKQSLRERLFAALKKKGIEARETTDTQPIVKDPLYGDARSAAGYSEDRTVTFYGEDTPEGREVAQKFERDNDIHMPVDQFVDKMVNTPAIDMRRTQFFDRMLGEIPGIREVARLYNQAILAENHQKSDQLRQGFKSITLFSSKGK